MEAVCAKKHANKTRCGSGSPDGGGRSRERIRVRIPVERANDSVLCDRISAGLLQGKPAEWGWSKEVYQVARTSMREMTYRGSQGKQTDPQRKGWCHSTGYQKEMSNNRI